MVEENKTKGLRETLDDINNKLDRFEKLEEPQTKKWSLPFLTKFGMCKKKKRKGYVVFVNIGLNKAITFIKAPIIEGVAMVNGIPHVIEPEDILIWKNRIPMIIQPQFSERPYSAKHNYELVREKGEGTEGWQYIMNYLMNNQITDKKKMPVGAMIIGAIVIIGLGWYLIKSGAFK